MKEYSFWAMITLYLRSDCKKIKLKGFYILITFLPIYFLAFARCCLGDEKEKIDICDITMKESKEYVSQKVVI